MLSSKKLMVAASAGVTAAFIYSQKPQQLLQARNWHSNAHLKYPASANYPDLSQHNNIMADHLTPGVSAWLSRLSKAIQSYPEYDCITVFFV